jgi:hypothetical protein
MDSSLLPYRSPKKPEDRHSERRLCAKNLSYALVVNHEGFVASFRMTTKLLFLHICFATLTAQNRSFSASWIERGPPTW